MSLDPIVIKRIVAITDAHVVHRIQGAAFAELLKGQEHAQRITEYVEDQIASLLKVNLQTRHEIHQGRSKGRRSKSDLLVHSNAIFNPIRVMASVQGIEKRSGLVTVQRLLGCISAGMIDSYYVLIDKIDLAGVPWCKSYLIDLLDWPDFVTCDATLGHIGLLEREFYSAFEENPLPRKRSLSEKMDRLAEKIEEGVRAAVGSRKFTRDALD